jgi:hypothetical protein
VSSDKANLKFNYASAYATNPSVLLSVNNVKVSNLFSSRTVFPGGGYGVNVSNFPDYLAVAPGATEFGIAIPKRNTDTDSIKLYSTSLTLQSGKHYTAHIADTGTKTKTVLLEDDLTPAPTGFSRFRFVHLIPNAGPLDLYVDTVLVASGIPYLGSSNFFTVRVPAAAPTWSIRETSTGRNGAVLATYSNANTVISRRVYTAFAMGYKGVPTTDAARRTYVGFALNL